MGTYDNVPLETLERLITHARRDPLGKVLSEVGGWHVGCQNDVESADLVCIARARGYVTERMHYAPAIPEGVAAYELTDAGIEAVRELCGEENAMYAERVRSWYRENATKDRI